MLITVHGTTPKYFFQRRPALVALIRNFRLTHQPSITAPSFAISATPRLNVLALPHIS